jgi:hypothetical protein
MAFPCPLCHEDILGTLDVPAEVGGIWICCVCHDEAVKVEVEHFVANQWDIFTEIGSPFTDESDEDPANLCSVCGIVLHQFCCRLEDGFCCQCHVSYNSDSEDDPGSSEDDIDSSTEAPADHEDVLEEDIAVVSDFDRSEVLYLDDDFIADEAESLSPDIEDVGNRVQESQPDLDACDPQLKRSKH